MHQVHIWWFAESLLVPLSELFGKTLSIKIAGAKDQSNLKLFNDLLKSDYFEKFLTIATIATKY